MENHAIRVVLVESDLKFARVLREHLAALTDSRIDLAVTATLEDAVQELQQNQNDAVLLDLFLADSEGISTVIRVRSEAPNLPIVVLTCCENEALALQALSLIHISEPTRLLSIS